MKTRIFLADDHTIVVDGLRLLLEAQSDFEVIGEAADGREAVRKISRRQPDVVIMDIAMPELNGIEATQQILEQTPEIRIIILSMHASSGHIARALQAGAQGYVLKSSVGSEVIEAIRTVRSGGRYLSRKIPVNVLDDYLAQVERGQTKSLLTRLSAREREVLQLVAEGNSSAQIAETLSLAPSTIDTYRSRLMQKLEINDVPSLVKFAIRHGLISLE